MQKKGRIANRKQGLWWLVVVGLWLLALVPCHAAAATEGRGIVDDFELRDLKGRSVRLSDYRGQVVVVNFWATWCEPCKQELSFFQRYFEKHKGDGLRVLALATDGPETLAQVRRVVRRKKWKMPVLLDSSGRVSSRLNPRGVTPFTLFVDRQGRLAQYYEGYKPGDEVKYGPIIEGLLGEAVSKE